MIKCFCDRCGKEAGFESANEDGKLARTIAKIVNPNYAYSVYKNEKKVHLCADCQNDLAEWLKGADK